MAGRANREAKYKTLTDLRAAYQSGAIPQDLALRIDNDCCYLYDYVNFTEEEEKTGKSPELLFWYDFPGETLLEEALKLLGIPSEGA